MKNANQSLAVDSFDFWEHFLRRSFARNASDVSGTKSKQVTLPAPVWDEIDRRVKWLGTTREQFLTATLAAALSEDLPGEKVMKGLIEGNPSCRVRRDLRQGRDRKKPLAGGPTPYMTTYIG